jgi:hypothetical protein
MRLLELRGSDSGTSTAPTAPLREPIGRPVIPARSLKKPLSGQRSPANARVFPINSRPGMPARRPIDLGQLLQRIEELEKRIQQRQARQADAARQEDVEQLIRRIKLLEQRVENELWNARQREHSMLELLAKQPLAVTLRQGALRFLEVAPRTIWHWCKVAGRAWWHDAQPHWWPRLAAAWEQAWIKAQG